MFCICPSSFIFIRLRIREAVEYAAYQKINILLLESRQPEEIERFSDVVIIDKDACEIVLNM